MYVQDNLLHTTTNLGEIFPDSKFLLVISGLVAGPLVVMALAWRDEQALNQPSLLWSFLMIVLLLLIGVGVGFWRFNSDCHAAAGLSKPAQKAC